MCNMKPSVVELVLQSVKRLCVQCMCMQKKFTVMSDIIFFQSFSMGAHNFARSWHSCITVWAAFHRTASKFAPPALSSGNILQIMTGWPFDTSSRFPFLARVRSSGFPLPFPRPSSSLPHMANNTERPECRSLPLRHPPSPSLGHLIRA